MINRISRRLFAALLLALPALALAAPAAKPLRVLLVTGGCCHDYAAQKDLLKAGLEARAHVVVEHMHTPDKTTKPPLPLHTDANYGKGYDVIIHDECAAAIDDPAALRNVLQPHVDGIPGVNLHCAMHSYRVSKDFRQPLKPGSEGAAWFDYLGLQSSAHGPKEPITITFAQDAGPITRGMAVWVTGNEELYNNVQDPKNYPGHRALATGRQITTAKDGTKREATAVVAWTNEFGPKKTRVFSTTIGHNNETVADARYLDLVTRGLLWAAGKLNADGTPAKGYGPGGK
ncbi:MAG: ThuA domain-containing protein [Opitutaceae bacterium]|nr:ThuA domain-containing protein [Opitutaceae bacterium]